MERMSALLSSSLKINLIGGGLVLLGLILLVVTLAFWKAAVEDPEVLAPLEVMSDRKFARGDESKRLALMNQVRKEGAEPVVHLASPPVLTREPISEPVREFRDPYAHDDDAVDVLPSVIDPLLGSKE